MKTKVLSIIVVLLIVTNAVSLYRINKFEYYYNSTEKLLDKLEDLYNWVDAVDDEDYYEAVSRLKNK